MNRLAGSNLFHARSPLLNGQYVPLLRMVGGYPRPLGTIVSRSIDEQGYERFERIDGIAACPICGKDIELIADTEQWVRDCGRWIHWSYGPAQGVCCERLIASWWEGTFAFDLREPSERTEVRS